MKRQTIIRPSGKLISYREFGFEDFTKSIQAQFFGRRVRSEFEKIANYRNAGRRHKEWSKRLNRYICQESWKIILDALMEKDRLVLGPDRVLVLGVKPGEKRRHDSWGEERNVSLHIQGRHNNFNFRMSRARREQLRKKVEDGEVFHNAN